MANQKRMIDYEIQFRTNQQSLQNVNKVFRQFFDNFKFSDLQLINNSTKDKATKDLLEIRETANTVEAALTAAFNPKLGITNIDTFKNNLKAAGTSIEQVRTAFDKAGGAGTQAFQAMANSLTNVRLKATESESIIDKMGETLKRTLTWSLSSSVINKMAGSIQEAYGYVKHLDSSLNDIRIVTEYSAEAMDKFAEKANKAAITLGKSTTDYTEAALIYYQQGLGEEDVAARTDVTLKTANVTQQSTAQVSEELTAIWNGYKANAEEAEAYIDKVAKVAAVTAADLEEMATGMSKVASAANVMGVDIDQMNAILATTISVTRQAPESVGAAYKTIFARMSQIQAGEETEDGATLKSYTEQMAAMGVSVLDANNKLRDMGDIIEEVGNKWSSWGREQQIAFAQVAAGTRQYNNLIALFDNWSMYEKTLEESKNALGTLQTQQDIYMESTAAHLQQLRTAAEGVYDSLINAKDINSVVDVFTKWAKGIETVADGLGGLKGILGTLSPLLISSFSSNIGQVLSQGFSNINIKAENAEKIQQLTASLNELEKVAPAASQKYIRSMKQLAQNAAGMKPEDFNKIAANINKQGDAIGLLAQKELDEQRATNEVTKAKTEQTAADKALKKAEEDLLRAQDAVAKAQQRYNQITETEKKRTTELILKNEALVKSAELQIETYNKSQAIANKRSPEYQAARQNYQDAKVAFEREYQAVFKNAPGSYGAEFVVGLTQQQREDKREDAANKAADAEAKVADAANAEKIAKGETLKAQNALNAAKSEGLEIQKQEVRHLGEGLAQVAAGVASLHNLNNSVKQLQNIWNKNDITNTEKMTQSLALMATTIPSVIFGVTQLASGFKNLTIGIKAIVPALAESTVAHLKNTGAIIDSTGASAADLMMQYAHAKGIKGVTVALLEQVSAWMIANAWLIIIVATFAAVAAAIYKTNKEMEKEKKALDASNKALEDRKNQLSEIKNKVNDFKSLTDELKEEQKALQEATKNTEEWADALDKVNGTVEKLLEEFPELYKYTSYQNGQKVISEEGLNEYENILNQQQQLAQIGLVSGKKTQIDATIAERNSAARELYGKQDKGIVNEAYKIAGTTGAGLGFLIEGIKDSVLKDINADKAYSDLISVDKVNEKIIEIEQKIADGEKGLEGQLNYYQGIAKIQTEIEEAEKKRLDIIKEEVEVLNKEKISKWFEDFNGSENIANLLEKGTMAKAAASVDAIATTYRQIFGDIKSESDTNETYRQAVTLLQEQYGGLWTGKQVKNEATGKKEWVLEGSNGQTVTMDQLADIYANSLIDVEEWLVDAEKNRADRLVEYYRQGSIAIDEMTQEAVDIIKKEIPEIQDEFDKYNSSIRNGLATRSERQGYDKAANAISDWNTLSFEQKKQIADKIHEAFKEGGDAGIQNLVQQMQGTKFEAAVSLTVKDPEEDLTQALKDAGVKEADFLAEKAYRDVQRQDYSDQAIINYLKAQKELNEIYKDRNAIFDSLNNFSWATADNTQKEYLTSLKSALEALTGEEVKFDYILSHLQLIKQVIEGDTAATAQLSVALKTLDINAAEQSINGLFENYKESIVPGEEINADLQASILEWANDLQLTQDEIKDLFANYGYIQDESGKYIYTQKFATKTVYEPYEENSLEYQMYVRMQQEMGEEALSYAKWMASQGWKEQVTSEGIQWYREEQYVVERDYKEFWNRVSTRTLTIDEWQKLLGVLTKEEVEALGGTWIDAWHYQFTTTFEVQQIINQKLKAIDETADGGGTADNGDKTSTKALKQTVYTPKLDTSAEDREIKELNNKIKIVRDAQKDLSGDSLQASIDKEIELENELYSAKLRKIEKEKEYRRELETSLQQNLNGQDALLGFEKDANGYITNIEDVEKAYVEAIRAAEKEVYDEENSSTKDESKLAEKRQTLEDLKEARSSLNSYAQSYNKSLETTNSLTEEEYQHLRKIQELTEKKAQAGAERTAATSKALADIEYQAEKTSKALDHLGEAGDLSGSALVKYNEARINLLKQEEEAAEKRTKILKQERDELLGSVNDSSETDSLYGNINRSGLNLDVSFRDDGSVDLEDLRVQYEKIQEENKDNETYLTEIAGYWKTIEKYAERYNSNLDENNKSIEDWLKYSKEIARLNASMKYAEINAELEEAGKKAGIFKQNLEHAKVVFDKAGDNKKNFVKGYIESLEEYDKVQEAVLKRSAERFEKLKQDWNPKSDTTALSAAFNAEDMESFMAVYGDAQLELIELDKELEKELAETQASMSKYVTAEEQQSKEYLDLVKKAEKLKQAQDQLEKSTDDLADKYEHLSSKMADMSQVADLSKEWKTAAVDREIKKVNRELSLLQKQQSRLKGKDVIANLQQQVAVIQKQINLEKNKLKILQAQAQTQRVLIQEMITQMQLQGLGSAFDSSGHVNAAFLDKLAKKADLANEKVQMIISALKDYESIMNEIESQQDAIVSLQDEIADKQYEISEKIYEETRKEAEKLLNKFKIEIEVELNEAEMMRKIDRLRAKVAAMPAWDLAGAMGLDIGDAVSYATKDVDILTNAVNKLITDYQSDAWKDFYDTQKDAYDDIISYANQLTSAVESFYDALDTARQKYSEAIDKVISANQELIDDLEEMKKISKHGINITKMLFGENSYEDLTTYYKKIQNTTREQLQAAKEQAAYYKALLTTIDPMKHPDEYESVKSALKSAIDETYAYAEEMGNQALEEMNAKVEDAARKLKDEFARVQGYENSTMQDLAHDYQQKILKDYLDTTESQYEMVTLQNKFTKAINDTTNASEKSKLSKVMKEQVGYLQQQVEKTGRLTKYEVDRANMMYDLTLKQMALEEARDNKTKMRLRRDSQGNYRYEYIADAEKTAEAQQDLLEQQYKIYELDKKRLLELYDEKEKLIEEFNQKQIDILNNQYLTEAEKEQAVNELKEQYYGENGYLIQLGRDYAEAVHNIDESADGELDKILEDIIEETGRTSEEIQNNFIDVANAMDNFANEGLAALDQYTTDVQDALASLTDGLGNLEATVDMNINTIMELADVDLELIDVWMEQVDVCGDLMAQLEELEDHYRGVMQAALDAAEAAAKLKVTDFSTADERKEKSLTGNAAAQGATNGNFAASGSTSSKTGGNKDKKATIQTEVLYLDGVPIHMAYPELSDMAGTGKWSQDGYNALYSKHPELQGLTQSPDLSGPTEGYKQYGKLTKKKITLKFDTGGYTGEWGAGGRLAMLHQKELVLNAKDTENFLKAADVMRTLQSNIEQIQNYANTMSPSFNISAPSSDLNQNVKIEASFPGVTNSREIEDAFNNLVNLASQRAMSTRR